MRAGLARDAVRSEARGHRPPSWWHELEGCGRVGGLPAIPAGAYRGSGPRRLAYRRGDPAARDLAERLVALATGGGAAAAALAAAVPELPSDRLGLVAVGLELEELEERMRLGEDFAYVTDLPRRALDPCHERRRLASGAEWLALEDVPLAATLIPLVDTRRRLIARRGRAAGYLDWEGTVRIWAPAPLDVGR